MKKFILIFLLTTFAMITVYSQSYESDVLEMYAIGDSLFKEKQYIEAYNLMSTVVFWSDSTYSDAFYMKAVILRSMFECERAIEEIAYAIKLNPNVSDYYFVRGHINEDCVGFEEAFADYNKAIELDSLNVGAYLGRAHMWGELGYFDYEKRCLADYNKAIELNPYEGALYFNRGQLKESMGDMEGACKDWKRAVELGFGDLEQYSKRCNCNN